VRDAQVIAGRFTHAGQWAWGVVVNSDAAARAGHLEHRLTRLTGGHNVVIAIIDAKR
jgi:hypothetical protein